VEKRKLSYVERYWVPVQVWRRGSCHTWRVVGFQSRYGEEEVVILGEVLGSSPGVEKRKLSYIEKCWVPLTGRKYSTGTRDTAFFMTYRTF
jgi:hypothetical protein